MNYSWLLNKQLSLLPELQLILHPDGRNPASFPATRLGFTLRFCPGPPGGCEPINPAADQPIS